MRGDKTRRQLQSHPSPRLGGGETYPAMHHGERPFADEATSGGHARPDQESSGMNGLQKRLE